MSEVVGVLHGIPAPIDQWDPAAVEGIDALDALTYRSNLLGSDRALANIGGGNTSAKGTLVDHTGRELRALSDDAIEGAGVDVEKLGEAAQKAYMGYVFLATLQELIIQHLDATILEGE